eukprot:jgi/Undpi1/11063/HiC_scaffold_30.g13361.m1
MTTKMVTMVMMKTSSSSWLRVALFLSCVLGSASTAAAVAAAATVGVVDSTSSTSLEKGLLRAEGLQNPREKLDNNRILGQFPEPEGKYIYAPGNGSSGSTTTTSSSSSIGSSSGAHPSQREALSITTTADSSDISECILLFGAFCNGNMGDVIQPIAMQRLLASVAPTQCFWYAHPWNEDSVRGFRIGEFFGGDTSRLIHLTSDHADQVNRFKALIIGGGGVFAARHDPLHVEKFAEGLTLPIVIMGVGASYRVKENNSLAEKALFVSGRDVTSIKAFSEVLKHCETPVVLPEDVALVRDPVLSDKALSDTEGTCWRQTEGMQTRALRHHIL